MCTGPRGSSIDITLHAHPGNSVGASGVFTLRKCFFLLGKYPCLLQNITNFSKLQIFAIRQREIQNYVRFAFFPGKDPWLMTSPQCVIKVIKLFN